MRIKKYMLCVISTLLIVGCESIEDTYSEFTEKGFIRYVGKCENVTVSPGWERLIVRWENSDDPIIVNIKITWEKDGKIEEKILPKDTDEFNIEGLEDGSYKISIMNLDKNGKSSLVDEFWSRPYTYEHETIRSFTAVVNKYFFVKNRLVLFFSNWHDGIEDARIEYTNSGGQSKTLDLNKRFIESNKYYLLPEAIDPSKSITLYRNGRVEGCEDLIAFDPLVFSKDLIFTNDLKKVMLTKYGITELTQEAVDKITELEYDFDINSFEDILALKNLEQLHLGKNRYMYNTSLLIYNSVDFLDFNEGIAKLFDREKSLFVLNIASQIMGVDIFAYNAHYFPGMSHPSFVTVRNNPTPSAIEALSPANWTITCSQENLGTLGSMRNLFDNNPSTPWEPDASSTVRTYKITIDMKKLQRLNGVKIVQNTSNDLEGAVSGAIKRPISIKFEATEDGLVWNKITHDYENTIGNTNGEINIINFIDRTQARQLRIYVNDRASSNGETFTVSLADIVLF